MLKQIIQHNIELKKMEEKIETLLKEKELSTQVIVGPIIAIPMIVVGTVGESTSEITKSTSTTSDLKKFG